MGEEMGKENGEDKESPKNNSNSNSENPKKKKAKSCKGCLYYSSSFKSNARNPLCVGITRSLPQAPHYIVGESEMEASRDGRSFADFKYACVGYSVYSNGKVSSADMKETQTELPVCVGLEVLVDRRVNTADPVPAHVHTKEAPRARRGLNFGPDVGVVGFLANALWVLTLLRGNTLWWILSGFPQPRTHKPAHSVGDEFLGRQRRFSRNATVVAMGVAKNLRRVGNQMKERLDDILYPYRRRPK
ncbi:hypothetical protein HYC85_002162 [Camellia sinensis]|uniref:DUF8204 domain-containing protein n=1 Tax=Camellia sinensis TaxID=4442 RepID=A0A7J7I7G0_CAMSI|nr:hypothetical protein HYC85_002162 [Camellia sinensis]